MKKRRIVITAFLLVACMVIGLGYANISRTLKVNGNIETGASTLEVYFTTAASAGGEGNLCSAAALDNPVDNKSTAVTMNTGTMNTPGQTASAVFTIKNFMEDVAVSVTHANHYITLNGQTDSTYFVVSHEFIAIEDPANTEVVIADGGQSVTTLPAGATVQLKVTITLDKPFIDETQNAIATLVGNFTATAK